MTKELHISTTSPYIGFFVFDQPFLLIRDLDIIKKILITDFDYFTDRTPTTNKNDKIGSKLLFILKGDTWKELRRFLTSLFSLSKLKMMVPLINETGDKVVQHLENNIHKKSINSRDVSLKYSLDVISSCAFGLEANALEDSNSSFVQATFKLFEVTFVRAIHILSCFFSPSLVNLLNFTFTDGEALITLSNIFKKVCEERKKSGKVRNDLIDILNNVKVEDNTHLNDEYKTAHAIQVLFAGHETAGTTLSFLMYELSRHVDVQNRLRDEVQNVLHDNAGDISYKTINEMTYLDMVINETLRKYPVLALLDRRCVKSYNLPNTDLIIEKGMPVYISILALHYDEKYFRDPEKFDPERFSDENKLSIPTCAYMPFGEGNRFCIGKPLAFITMKIFTIKVLSNFKIEATQDTPKSIKFDQKGVLLVPENEELKLRFTKI
ncbi:hypothetical protein FQR65_LT06056 [Abscondita terminalis]|nr:hypothetical protein FQR65_LT06056 [Abscondita terminalis]